MLTKINKSVNVQLYLKGMERQEAEIMGLLQPAQANLG
jgi:hypothetical protein